MFDSKAYLENEILSLRKQHENAIAIANQAHGALLLAEAQLAEIAKAEQETKVD